MLCKVDNNDIPQSFTSDFTITNYVWLYNNRTWQGNWNSTRPYGEDRKATLFTAPFKGSYRFTIKAQCNNSTASKLWVGYNDGLLNILDERTLSTASSQTDYIFIVNLEAGQTIYMYPYLTGSYPNITIGSDNSAYTVSFNLTKNQNIPGTPKEIKTIWNTGTIIIYWIDNKLYKGGIMLSKDTSATTGSITLGNAVGYIKVNLNGEIVKIPYYWN